MGYYTEDKVLAVASFFNNAASALSLRSLLNMFAVFVVVVACFDFKSEASSSYLGHTWFLQCLLAINPWPTDTCHKCKQVVMFFNEPHS